MVISCMARTKIRVGDVYGEWTVIAYPITVPKPYARVPCRCSCGVERDVISSKLVGNITKSCGHRCWYPDALAARTKPKHGFGRRYVKRPPEYTTWLGLKDRCNNPNNPRYKHYGGRGITVCERWQKSFTDFLEDMGYKPSPRLSIDRINNDGNYEPSNCRWATSAQQHANQRHHGKRKVICADSN